MAGEERAVRILGLLEYLNSQERAVPVSELALLAHREYGVSEVTLRSDLAALCSLSGVRKLSRGTYEAVRDHTSPSLSTGSLFGTRLLHRAEQKIAIAGSVAGVLLTQSDLRVVLLDAGTTTYYLADRLSESTGLDVIVWTPNVAAATRLAGSRGISVRVLGGEYQSEYFAVAGDETVRALRSLQDGCAAQATGPYPGVHCVLDVNQISPDGGLFTDESRERQQKSLMAELAEDLTIVADSSKLFARRLGYQPHSVLRLSELGEKRSVRVVTDSRATPEQRAVLKEMLQTAFPMAGFEAVESEGACTVLARGPFTGAA